MFYCKYMYQNSYMIPAIFFGVSHFCNHFYLIHEFIASPLLTPLTLRIFVLVILLLDVKFLPTQFFLCQWRYSSIKFDTVMPDPFNLCLLTWVAFSAPEHWSVIIACKCQFIMKEHYCNLKSTVKTFKSLGRVCLASSMGPFIE